ncbi:MAG: YncE family protein [Caldilinea sp. CFX5]|nr:YncE family protein [Caldilinea sp. CFX5]
MQHLSHPNHRQRRLVGSLVTVVVTVAVILAFSSSDQLGLLAQDGSAEGVLASAAFDTPTTSSPIAMSQDKSSIWVVNPDDGSVSVLGNLDSTPSVLTTVKNVGREPHAIALDTGVGVAQRAYVVSPPDNGVTVLKVNSLNPFTVVVEKRLTTGAEPWNVVASPDGSRIFVANSGQDTITMINAQNQSIVGSVNLRTSACNVDDAKRRFQPRGLAVTLDGTRLYVARFFSYTKPNGVQGADGGKEGVVCQLTIPADVATLPTVAGATRIAAMDSGFKNPNGSAAISHPNQLQSIVIFGNQVYLPNIGASTGAPDRFNVSTQAHVNVLDNANSGTPADAPTKAVNMHLGARVPESGKKKLFFANPWAIAFRDTAGPDNAYAVSSGSDLLVKLNVDASGDLTFTVGVSTTRYIDLNDPDNPQTSGRKAGKNPLGIVIRNNKAFVMNYVSRNVSVVNLDTDAVENVIETTALPPAASVDEQLLVGKEVFFASRGHFSGPAGLTVANSERLSNEGWQTCSSCHFAGGTDGNVWFFGSGPRKSVPLNATWSPHNPDDQRLLNYSAVFDEIQDFDLNVRNTSGPGPLPAPQPCSDPAPGAAATSTFDPNHGLILGDTDPNKGPCVINQFLKPNAGRNQVTVTLPGSSKAWPAFDAMKEWVRFAIRTPEGALTAEQIPGTNNDTGAALNVDVRDGRRLFFRASCHTCHGGTKWTISNKDFTSPPPAAELATEAPLTATNASQLQMFDRMLFEIGSFNLNVAGQNNTLPGQPEIGAVELNNAGLKALGFDHNNDGKGNGYNIPALLGIGLMPPYYHNGACETLACVLTNQKHRTNNGQFTDVLANAADQAKVVAWLETLDADTPFPLNLSVRSHDIFVDPPAALKGSSVKVGANIQLFGTRSDLQDLLADLGLTAIKVRIEADPGLAPIELSVPATAFRDFGQVAISTTWNIPASAGNNGTIKVTVDPNGEIPEANERDNTATRNKRLRSATGSDNVPPVVGTGIGDGAFISDDATFNDQDPIAVSRNVKVKIIATDQGGSNLQSYCIVRYRFDTPNRQWLPLTCDGFKPLPAPTGANTFIVDAEIVPVAGVTYAFVWVKDGAGNISAVPGFDVISYIPSGAIELNRNDVLLFRIPLAVGQTQSLSFVPERGDVDVVVFDDFTNPNAQRIDESINNGAVCEDVTLTATAGQPNRFQVEVKAVANSRFTIKLEPCPATAVTASAVESAPSATLPDTPTISGPPALRAAIDDETTATSGNLFLPLVIK